MSLIGTAAATTSPCAGHRNRRSSSTRA